MANNVPKMDLYAKIAKKNGCKPLWYDGIVGWAWHCGCDDRLHAADSQCSVLSSFSARRNRKAITAAKRDVLRVQRQLQRYRHKLARLRGEDE